MNLYPVDFLEQENGWPVLISLMLDLDNQVFTATLSHLPDRTTHEQGPFSWTLAGQEPTGVGAEFLHGSPDRPWQPGACPHVPGDELTDLRNHYAYSASETYEHVYLNPGFCTW